MTATVCALVTDVEVDGKPVVGYGFNSNGRYGQAAILQDRMLPRLARTAPEELLDAKGLLDPARVHEALMRNEKPGGHGDRTVASGVVDMATWDAIAKVERRPLFALTCSMIATIQYGPMRSLI